MIEFGFFVDKYGRRSSSSDLCIRWASRPTFFVVEIPYIIAYGPSFIEVRHMETGSLVQILSIKGNVHLNREMVHFALPQAEGTCPSVFGIRRIEHL